MRERISLQIQENKTFLPAEAKNIIDIFDKIENHTADLRKEIILEIKNSKQKNIKTYIQNDYFDL